MVEDSCGKGCVYGRALRMEKEMVHCRAEVEVFIVFWVRLKIFYKSQKTLIVLVTGAVNGHRLLG